MPYETKRLILRPWQEKDIKLFIILNQDPEVMQFLQKRTPEETITSVNEFMQHFIKYGYTIYACILKSSQQFIGFVGLWHRFDMHFLPCVEIGWRIDKTYWFLYCIKKIHWLAKPRKRIKWKS
jgi:RimJ/RimL family protein N-acetyltransferase